MESGFEGGGTTSMGTTQSFTNTATMTAPQTGEVTMTQETPVVLKEITPAPEPVMETDFESPPSIARISENEAADRITQLATDADVDNTSLFERIASGSIFEPDKSRHSDEQIIDAEFRVVDESPDTKPVVAEEGVPQPQEKDPIEAAKKYVSKAVAKDPLYQQKLGEVVQEKTEAGEEIDPQAVQREATERYITAKTTEFARTDVQAQFEQIKTQYAELLQKHEALQHQLEAYQAIVQQQSEMIATMSRAVLELAQKIRDLEKDEEDELSLLELLIKLIVMIMQQMFEMEERDKQLQAQQKENEEKAAQKASATEEEIAYIQQLVAQQNQEKPLPISPEPTQFEEAA